MKQAFDLEKALAGHPLVTRGNREATNFRANSGNKDYPYMCDIHGSLSISCYTYQYPADGRYSGEFENDCDLFLLAHDTHDEPEPTNDNVKHPSHYTQGKIEVIDFIQDQKLNYARGNAIKYIIRAGLKNPATTIEDLEKAKQYIDFEINDLKRKNNDTRTN